MPPPITVLAQALDTGDLFADESGLKLVYGAEAVGTVLIPNCLRQRRGEDRMQPTRGIDWSDLLGKGASPIGIRTVIVRQVATVSGVTRVVSCEVGADLPTLPATMRVETTEGDYTVTAGIG